MFPPRQVSFAVGAMPDTLCPVEGGPYPVQATAKWQVFFPGSPAILCWSSACATSRAQQSSAQPAEHYVSLQKWSRTSGQAMATLCANASCAKPIHVMCSSHLSVAADLCTAGERMHWAVPAGQPDRQAAAAADRHALLHCNLGGDRARPRAACAAAGTLALAPAGTAAHALAPGETSPRPSITCACGMLPPNSPWQT